MLIRSRLDKVILGLLFLTIFTLFSPKENINSICIIMLGLALFVFGYYKNSQIIKNEKKIFLLSSLFFVSIYGFAVSEDKLYAIKIIQRSIPFAVFPLIFASKLKEIVSSRFIKFSLIISSFVATIYCQVNNLIYWNWVNSFSTNNFSLYEYFSHHWFTYSILTKSLDMHPVYFSLFIVTSLGFIIEYFFFKKEEREKVFDWIFIISSLHFILFIFQLSSKMGIIGVLLLLCIMFYRIEFPIKYKVIIFISGFLILFLLVRFSRLSYRINEAIEVTENNGNFSDIDINQSIKKLRIITFNAFIEQSVCQIVFGNGTGDAQGYLDKYYQEHIISKSKEKNEDWQMKGLNFHNQYLQTIAETGLIGIGALLSVLIFSLKSSIKKANIGYMTFVLLCIVFFLTESYFVRHKGIVYFSLFNSFFLLENYKKVL